MAVDEQTELLREMRDLLRVMAEPALAERDKKLRAALLEAVGKSKHKAEVVLLMDGSRTNAQLHKESGMDHGNVSRFVMTLRAKELLQGDEKYPELVISIPSNFFDNSEASK
jgi:hypothetical protein